MPRNANGYCTQDCPGCSNCLSMAPPPTPKGGRNDSFYYSHSETVVMSNSSSDDIEPPRRRSSGNGHLEDVKDKINQLSIANAPCKPTRRRNTLDNIGEDEVVHSHSPGQLLLPPAGMPTGARSTLSTTSRGSSRAPRSTRGYDYDDDDDSRTVMTVDTITPSESGSVAPSRVSRTTSRRSTHPPLDSRVSSQLSRSLYDDNDDTSTIRGPRSSHRDVSPPRYSEDNHMRSSRRPASSVVSTRMGGGGGGSEITSRVGTHRGTSEVGSRISRHHDDDSRSAMSSRRFDDLPDSVLVRKSAMASRSTTRSHAPSIIGSRAPSTVRSHHPSGASSIAPSSRHDYEDRYTSRR